MINLKFSNSHKNTKGHNLLNLDNEKQEKLTGNGS